MIDVHTSLMVDGRIVVAFILDDSSIERVVVDSHELTSDISDETLALCNQQLLRVSQGCIIPEIALGDEVAAIEHAFVELVVDAMQREYSNHHARARVHLSGVAHIASESETAGLFPDNFESLDIIELSIFSA